MHDRTERFQLAETRYALLVVALGVAVVVAPLVLRPSPGSGPIGFAVRSMQAIVAVVGLGVAATGVYSYRTGDPRPAVAAGTSIVALTVVGTIRGAVEMAGGPLVPVWVWVVAASAAVLASVAVTNRVAGERTAD